MMIMMTAFVSDFTKIVEVGINKPHITNYFYYSGHDNVDFFFQISKLFKNFSSVYHDLLKILHFYILKSNFNIFVPSKLFNMSLRFFHLIRN